MYEEPERPMDEVCMLCGENEPMPNRDICSKCGSDARTLGREAEWLLSEEPDQPEW